MRNHSAPPPNAAVRCRTPPVPRVEAPVAASPSSVATAAATAAAAAAAATAASPLSVSSAAASEAASVKATINGLVGSSDDNEDDALGVVDDNEADDAGVAAGAVETDKVDKDDSKPSRRNDPVTLFNDLNNEVRVILNSLGYAFEA